MQFLIVFISYLINNQHVSSDIRSSSGVLFTVHTVSGYLRCYLSVALSCCYKFLIGNKNYQKLVTTRQCHGQVEKQITGDCMYSK
jgi:hypothetical protein